MTISPDILFNLITGALLALAAWCFVRVVKQIDRIEDRMDEHQNDLTAIKTRLNMSRRRTDSHPAPEPPEL